ncbi:MAG: succinic semialdehyde dehydrogenase [Solirubrobacterales bacterium]|nr:succinic semialdehyde dehydrogenase [Solirubrobacterales bacterium]
MSSTHEAPVTEGSSSTYGSASTINVDNPATGEIVGTIDITTPDQLAEMAARGRAAQPGWEALGFAGRAEVFARCQKWIMDNKEELIETIISETGKTYEDALLAEISYTAGAFKYWAKEAPEFLADERVKTSSPLVKGRKLVVRHAPVGVVGVIGPWNFPMTNSFGDCIPAMAAGNSVILKPSEVTPLTSLVVAKGMKACGIPEGVFQVATGDGTTGSALIDNVDFIMFTGSTRTGRKVAVKAAENLIPYGLELGGKDPMIVMADADVERAANFASYFSMNNAGQVCISVERVYVEAPIYDEFVQKVTDKVKTLRQGASTGPGSIDLGAVIFQPQIDIVEAHVNDAVAKGAKVLTGGHAKREGGRFFEPTVLVDVDHTMDCMTEETFGPTLPIMKVDSVDEAIRLANDSVYGLQATVFSGNIEKAEAVARQLEAGAVCVNDCQVNYTALEIPMGGWKTSGVGVRHGAPGIRKYTKSQTILVTKFSFGKQDMYMHPYSAKTTNLFAKALGFLYGRGRNKSQ